MPREAARIVPWPPDMLKIKNAVECENAEIISKSPGVKTLRQQMHEGYSEKWSKGAHLFIEAQKPGDFVEMSIPVKSSEPQKLTLYATKGPEYGVIQFAVNGKKIEETHKMFSDKLISQPIELGVVEPIEGKIKLRAEILTANTLSRGSGIFCGLDCVVLTPEAKD